jgi:hypothetical protein
MDIDVIEENLRLAERIIDIGRDGLAAWPLIHSLSRSCLILAKDT